jgi:hypothetical protein
MLQILEELPVEEKHWEISSVKSAADVEYVGEKPVAHHFVDITIRLWRDFDWDRELPMLISKLRQAEKLNFE